jgi:hypothetical protein
MQVRSGSKGEPANTPESGTSLDKSWTPWGACHAAIMELFEEQTRERNHLAQIALTPIAYFFGLIAGGFALAGIGTLALFAVLAYFRLTPSVWAKPPRRLRGYSDLKWQLTHSRRRR